MDIVLELVKAVGFPAAMLVIVGWHHVRTVRAKDGEIARLNEERLEQKEQETARLLKLVQEFNQLQNEQQQTLSLLADRTGRATAPVLR